MHTICFDPFTGASGDMILAALFDLGADPTETARQIRSGGLTGFEIHFERRTAPNGLVCGYCEVGVHEAHSHGHSHADPGHRGLCEILAMIEASAAHVRAKSRASEVFRRLGEAEAAVHGVPVEDIHFHEVGAVDSVVDVFGACIALELLEIDRVLCSDFKTGHGTVRCAHGVLPVPAPATARLLAGALVTKLDIPSELTTPTGAAILTTLSEGDWTGIPLRLLRSGVGHGRKEFETRPNILRAHLCQAAGGGVVKGERITLMECEIDDQTPEVTAHTAARLMERGALDVSLTPVLMKKGRPGTRLTILAPPETVPALTRSLLSESSTIGVRMWDVSRQVLPRSRTTVSTPWGEVACKRVGRPTGVELVPEYESCREIAEAAGVPLRAVMDAARTWECVGYG